MNTASFTTIPDFLDANAFRIGLISLPQSSPVSEEEKTQFINGTPSIAPNSLYSAWFTYAGPIQGCLHKPTFDSNGAAMNPSNASAYEFQPLYNAVLGLGACLRGDIQAATQFLQLGWGLIAPRLFTSHSLQTVQTLYLLVRHALEILTR
jgi:hypothetical protein